MSDDWDAAGDEFNDDDDGEMQKATGNDDDNDSWGSDNGAEFDDANNAGNQSDEEMGIDIEIANLFYEGEDLKRDAPSAALKKFQHLVDLASAPGVRLSDDSKTSLFHSLVHIEILLFNEFGVSPALFANYRRLLDFIPAVTRNEGAEAIEKILNSLGNSKDFQFLSEIYRVTCQTLETLPDTERLLFSVKMKLCKTFLEQENNANALAILAELHALCRNADGSDDRKNRAGELLEIYAIEIKLSLADQNESRMRELYEKTKDLTAAVKDPRSQSLIRECWGQMFGNDSDWSRAYAEFYSAFTHYQEIGNRDKAKQCLKYVVVANMLSGGEQNPFDAREAKVYQSDEDISAVVGLRAAYEKCDVNAFAAALAEINKTDDKFLQTHLAAMIRDFQGRAIVRVMKSYRRVKLSHLAQLLKVSQSKVESILVQLILDGELLGKIDRVNGILDLTPINESGGIKKFAAIQKWNEKITSIGKAITQTRSNE